VDLQGGIERRLTQRLARGLVDLLGKMGLEADSLLPAESLEALIVVKSLESVQRGRDHIQCRCAATAGVAQPSQIFTLRQFVFGIVFPHGSNVLSKVTIEGGSGAIH